MLKAETESKGKSVSFIYASRLHKASRVRSGQFKVQRAAMTFMYTRHGRSY